MCLFLKYVVDLNIRAAYNLCYLFSVSAGAESRQHVYCSHDDFITRIKLNCETSGTIHISQLHFFHTSDNCSHSGSNKGEFMYCNGCV